MLSDDMEDLIAHMDITGGSAWGKLFDYLTSTLKVDYEGEVITLPAVRNLATSEDKEVRKKAYEAELASYDKNCRTLLHLHLIISRDRYPC